LKHFAENSKDKVSISNKLLVIDCSYCLEAIKERSLEGSVTCRDLNGYFSHVWSVHPFASLVSTPNWGPKYGRPISYELEKSHTFIEGKVGISPLFSWISPLNFIFSQVDVLIYLIRLIRREKINIIRVGDPLYLGFLGWVLSRLTGVPFVVRVGANNEKIRQTTSKGMMPRLFKTMNQERVMEKFVFSRANLVAGANQDNLNFAIRMGAKPERTTLFRYGNLIHASHFVHPSKRKLLSDIGNGYLLYIGRLELVKKADDVIRVLAEVRKNGIYVTAFLVGDGSERKILEKLAEELGVSAYVIFWGNRDQQWLSSVIPKASVVLSPHTGRALTEAALGGAPVVAYDIDWQPELIKTGITGELVEYGNTHDFAEATIKLLRDASYAKKLGNKLREVVLEMMDPEKLNQHERNEYNKLIKKTI
jgi:glycosyltransferase involved in cell wall biosynthesis